MIGWHNNLRGRAQLALLLLAALLPPLSCLDVEPRAAGVGSGRRPLWSKPARALLDPWDEQLGEQAVAAHASIARWLNRFFATEPPEALFPPPPRRAEVKPRQTELAPRLVDYYNESAEDRHAWTKWGASQTCDDVVRRAARPAQRTNLVISPVGSSFDASKWMTHPEHSTFDIVALYYGSSPDFVCPLCKAVIRGKGTKWFLLNAFTRKHPALWDRLQREYDAVMVADDDLLFDTCTLNRAFELLHSYGLLLAQPSLCPAPHATTYWAYLHQASGSVLRFITFVEIMAPMFEMDFFEGLVRPTLYNAFAGWGLDFTWPFLLRYPRRRIAVIDEVCMHHSSPMGSKRGEGDLYSVPVPYDEREEEARRVGEYGYYPSRVEAMGLPYRNMETVGVVSRTYTSAAEVPRARPPRGARAGGRKRGKREQKRQVLGSEPLAGPALAARLLVAAVGAAAGAAAMAVVLQTVQTNQQRRHLRRLPSNS